MLHFLGMMSSMLCGTGMVVHMDKFLRMRMCGVQGVSLQVHLLRLARDDDR